MNPPIQFVAVADRDGIMAIGRDDLVKYAGAEQIVASALCLRLFALAFDDLSPGVPPLREAISVLVAFPGDGILDCVEMITRARTRGRLKVDTEAGPADVPPAIIGRFYFEISIRDQSAGYSLRNGFFTNDFLDMVKKHQSGNTTADEIAEYQNRKHALIGSILGATSQDLFLRTAIQ